MGSLEEKWVVLQKGEVVIGLFQDMFEKNSLTFNPIDARSIYHEFEEKGITFDYSDGIEKTEGPCYFTITDPDGNPILFDQHQ